MMPPPTSAASSTGSPAENGAAIEFRSVGFAIQKHQILSDVNLQVAAGETLVLLGRSGSGKSTLLDLMAGRLQPDTGTVERGPTVRLGYYDQLGVELLLVR